MDAKEKGCLIVFFSISTIIAAASMGVGKFFMYIGVGVVTVGIPLLIIYIKSK